MHASPANVAVAVVAPSAVYGMDAPVAFRVKAPSGARLEYRATWDGGAVIASGEVQLENGGAEVTVPGGRPGFIRLSVFEEPDGAPVEAAAAVAPEEIAPSLTVPEDFDAFWQAKLSAARSGSPNADVRLYAEREEGTIHAVRAPMADGSAVHGWLLRPTRPGPYPAVVRYHGAGVYGITPDNGLDWAERGIMVFSINPHAIPNDQPADYYEALRKGALADYRTRGRDSRDTLYFVEMFLRASRAVDFVASLREWDGRHLIAEGHSQGGGQAFAAAALNTSVTGLITSCPTHCDHSGPAIGRVAGWPRIVEILEGRPDSRQLEAARYIDAVNFATRIHRPALGCVCFLDDVCPPTAAYAAYNALRGAKRIVHESGMGHVHTEGFRKVTLDWGAEQFVVSRKPLTRNA